MSAATPFPVLAAASSLALSAANAAITAVAYLNAADDDAMARSESLLTVRARAGGPDSQGRTPLHHAVAASSPSVATVSLLARLAPLSRHVKDM